MEDYGCVVGSFDGIDDAERATLRSFDSAGDDGIESVFNVGGRERAAVVKFNAVTEVENVGARVGSFPALGQVGNEIHLRVAPDQAAEDQAVEALRLRVGADAGIEVGGHGFD